MTSIPRSLNLLVLAVTMSTSLQARAALISVPIDGLTNANLRTYTAGVNYPIAPASLGVGGVPFDLVPLAAVPDSLGVIQTPVGDSLFVIPADIFGVRTVYTLMNSAFGTSGVVNGRLEFVGTGAAFASFDLEQGFNLRDHFDGSFNNIVSDPTIVTVDFGGGVRLDRQTFELPASFGSETLTEIRLIGTGAGSPQGQAFLAAATVDAVPEPSTIFVWATGLGIALVVLRRTRWSAGRSTS